MTTDEGRWLEGLDPQSQREQYDRYVDAKRAMYDIGYMLGVGDGERVLSAVLRELFIYEPITETFQARAQYVSADMVRQIIKDAKKEEPF
jgi:hypothetical protein